jgi:AcrR family transcriptional regulator
MRESAKSTSARTRTDGLAWARPQSRRRPTLTREAIVEAAISVADAEGIDAVSIRRIATELGVRPMSLYTHIDRKEDLFDLMGDEIIGEVLVSEEELAVGWREALTSIANREREMIGRHPWVNELMGRKMWIGPNALRHMEQSLAALDELGLDLERGLQIVRAVDQYMFGYVSMEAAHSRMKRPLSEYLYMDGLAESGEYPRIAPILRTDWWPGVEGFEVGLKWLLDGIERDIVGKTSD